MGFPIKNVIVLVVTVTVRGPHPKNTSKKIYLFQKKNTSSVPSPTFEEKTLATALQAITKRRSVLAFVAGLDRTQGETPSQIEA